MAQPGSQPPTKPTSFSDLNADVLLMIYEAVAAKEFGRTHLVYAPNVFHADGSISRPPFHLAAALPLSWTEQRYFASQAAFREAVLKFGGDHIDLTSGDPYRVRFARGLQDYENKMSRITQKNPAMENVKSLKLPDVNFLLFLLADVLSLRTVRPCRELKLADTAWRDALTNVEVLSMSVKPSKYKPWICSTAGITKVVPWYDHISGVLETVSQNLVKANGLVYRDTAGGKGLRRLHRIRQEVEEKLFARFPKLKAIHYLCYPYMWVRPLRLKPASRQWTCWYRSPVTDTSFSGYEHIMDGAIFDQHQAEPVEEDWETQQYRRNAKERLKWTVWWTKDET